MENENTKEVVEIITERLKYGKEGLDSAVELATDFSINNSIPPVSLLKQCQCFLSKESYVFAYVFAKSSSNLLTGDDKANAHFIAGICAERLSNILEAEEQYKLALIINPNHFNTHSYYGVLLTKKGHKEEAEIHYKLALKIDSQDVVIRNNYGILLREMRRCVEAEKQYLHALEVDPNNTATHFNYGVMLREMRRLEEAEKHLKLALEASPNDVDTLLNYGILLFEIGYLEEAEKHYKHALKLAPNRVDLHYEYGNLFAKLKCLEEAEKQYKLALKFDPNHAATQCNYGILLKQRGCLKEAEEHYNLAIKTAPNYADTHFNYAVLLTEMRRFEEAEQQYKLTLEFNPKHIGSRLNYGLLLMEIGREEEAEQQFRLALEANPNCALAHSNYGILLRQVGRFKEAEEQFKIAIELDPNEPTFYGAYGLLLFSMNLEAQAIEKTKIASKLFRERGDRIEEHLSFAWLYEEFANKYYNLKNYRKSGQYAEIAGGEYIETSKHAGEKFKSVSLTKGYTLKGRAEICKLAIKTPFYKDIFKKIRSRESYQIETSMRIMDCIMNASRLYKKAAEASPNDGQMSNACSISMLCLSEILDYTLAEMKQEKTPLLNDKLKSWNEKMEIAEKVYKGHNKGELFIESLYKLMGCLQNLDTYKNHATREYWRAFEECLKELYEISRYIEGPLQKIIEDSAKQMDICRLKIIPYAGTETGYIHEPSILTQITKWLSAPYRITVGIVMIILGVVINHYNEYLFLQIQGIISMLLSKL
jgi:tetratricopeptide (TPR) repeat protein